MNRKLLLKFALFTVICLAGLSWGTQAKASALMCGVLAKAYVATDCTKGQDYTALTSLSGSSDQLKSQFITKMHGFEAGQYFQVIGASYIENALWDNSWNNYQMTWEQRISASDIKLSVENYTFLYNTAFNPANNQVTYYTEPSTITAASLVFRVNGVVFAAIKLDCGNYVSASLNHPTLPAFPIIQGSKTDEVGNTSGVYAGDNVKVTIGGIATIPASDTSNPFSFAASKNTYIPSTGATAIVSPDNTVTGWKLVGYETFTCVNNASTPPAYCSNSANYVAFTGSPPYTYSFAVKYNYVYTISFVYKLQSATIIGHKVDDKNSPTGLFSGDTISASSIPTFSGLPTPPSTTNNPFTFSVPAGIGVNVTVDAASQPAGWSVLKSTYCDSKDFGCINSNIPSGSNSTPSTSTSLSPIDGHTYYMWWVYTSACTGPSCGGCTGPLCTPPPVVVGGNDNCPTFPNPIVSVALPDQAPSSGPPPASTTNAGSTYLQDSPQGLLTVLSLTDKSTSLYGGNSVLPILDSPKLNVALTEPVTATLDYTPYIKTYQYDNNIASVNYSTSYKETPYISSTTVDFYTCPSGVTPNPDHTCTAKSTSGGSSIGNQTTTVTTPTYPTVCFRPKQPLGHGSQCPPNGSKTTTIYYCPTGYTPVGSGPSMTCSIAGTVTYSYTPATKNYYYHIQPSVIKTQRSTADGALMPPCYDRGFSVTTVNAPASVTLNSNYENPSTASATNISAAIKYSFPSGQLLRRPMQVPLTYSYKFTKGAFIPITSGCTGSGSYTISAGTGPFYPSSPTTYTFPSAGSCGVNVSAVSPGLAPGDTVCALATVSPTGFSTTSSGGLNSDGRSKSSSQQCSGKVVNEPYFKVFGGDVSAGNAFATTSSSGAVSCSANSSSSTAGVYGWNTATDPVYGQHYAGSGAQYAVTAPNVILGVASNQNNINAYPSAGGTPNPLGLSFSNTVNNSASAGQFGGNLTSSCITDFYSSLPATGVTPIGSGSLSGLNGKYTMTGGSTILASDIGSGQHVTIYATGNIFIADNITFQNSSYTSIDQIPSLILIVKGNIYISNNVKNLSGIYIAQPTTNASSDGYIYDCATSAGLPASSSSLYSSCGNQLVVNGSFIANKVSLMRTGITTGSPISSSLRGSITNETNAITNKNPAEIFNYGPAFWMNLALPQATATGTSSAGYDSIISLPPIL